MSKKKKPSQPASSALSERVGSGLDRIDFLDEHAEPRADGHPIPMFLFILILMVMYASDMHLMANRGAFDARIYAPYSNEDELANDKPVDPVAEKRKQGKKVYESACVACHQSSGSGLPGQFPPLAGSDWVQTDGANRVIRIVLSGAQGPITVSGMAFNNLMPPVGASLSDTNIADVLTYVRSEWGNKAPAVTPEQVKAVRTEIKDRGPWTPEELLKVPLK
ncbi:MAG: cytochrome c [Verrucomicrobia bacterium]|nr:cytochrome c [Verrucomicrobiota bacterium]MBI3871257.1 cytochrome c [Verrucomicrobiota bacterium]